MFSFTGTKNEINIVNAGKNQQQTLLIYLRLLLTFNEIIVYDKMCQHNCAVLYFLVFIEEISSRMWLLYSFTSLKLIIKKYEMRNIIFCLRRKPFEVKYCILFSQTLTIKIVRVYFLVLFDSILKPFKHWKVMIKGTNITRTKKTVAGNNYSLFEMFNVHRCC